MRRPALRHRTHRRSPLSLRDLLLLAFVAALGALLLTASPAGAHAGHQSLPEGFVPEIVAVLDEAGNVVTLPDVVFTVAADGIGATVTNTGERVVEVLGEQGGEPLIRVTASEAWVNEVSPQAVDVEGAVVDPDAVASLQDLAWGRVPPTWVALPAGGTVSWIDHRAAPGHPPVRADYSAGDVAAEWWLGFSHDGGAYRLQGQIVAVAVDGEGGAPWRSIGVIVGLLLLVGGSAALILERRRLRRARQTARDVPVTGKDREDADVARREALPVP
jgi:hypothetical protein